MKKVIYILILLTALYSVRSRQVRTVNKHQLLVKTVRGW